jgi:hypothetical protein
MWTLAFNFEIFTIGEATDIIVFLLFQHSSLSIYLVVHIEILSRDRGIIKLFKRKNNDGFGTFVW